MPITAPYKYLDSSQVSELLAFLPSNTIYTQWIDNTLTDEQKNASLYLATVLFDSLPWKGYKEWGYQDHAFPRKYRHDFFSNKQRRSHEDALGSGSRSEVGDLPYQVAMGFAITSATLADQELNGSSDEDEFLSNGISSLSIGSISVSLANQQGFASTAISDAAMDWLRPYAFISAQGKGVSTFRFL